MKKLLVILFAFVLVFHVFADDRNENVTHTSIIKLDNNLGGVDSESSPHRNVQVLPGGVIYYTTDEGIYLIVTRATSLKLFALTGQTLWNGNLVQGHFFIPLHIGIYFMRINDKSYKVICKTYN